MLKRLDKTLVNEVQERLLHPKEFREGRLMTGFRGLDRWEMGEKGFGNGEIIVLGGLPGMGKTSLVYSLIRNVCFEKDNTCFLFSTREPERRVTERLAKMNSLIDKNDPAQVSLAADELKFMDLWIDYSPVQDISKIVDSCIQQKESHWPDLIVIDELRLLNRREHELAMRELKTLAKEMECPIVVTTTLSRKIMMRENKYPQITDFHHCDVFDRYADMIMGLNRESYWDNDFVIDENPVRSSLMLLKSKWYGQNVYVGS